MTTKPRPPHFLGLPMKPAFSEWRGDHWRIKVNGVECVIHPDKWFRRGDTVEPTWEGWVFWGRYGEAFFGSCDTPHECARELSRHVRGESRFWKKWQPPVKGKR
jgi:hypothetical protein